MVELPASALLLRLNPAEQVDFFLPFNNGSFISFIGAPRDLYASVDPRTKKRRPPSSPGARGTRTRSADPASFLGPLASLELRTGKARADRDSRVDSGSVDLGTPLELSPKSPLEQLDEALDAVMPTASFTGIFRILIPTLKTTF